MKIVKTIIVEGEGIALDALVFETTGRVDLVALVLDANPGLAAKGPILPAGTQVKIPEAPEPEAVTTIPTVTLWSE
jgi:phage tail protein X